MKKEWILLPLVMTSVMACNLDTKYPDPNTNGQTESVTVTDQGENATDIKIVQNIRKALLREDSLSLNAKNIKVISKNGVITLRGAVENRNELDQVLRIVNSEKGISKVNNQLEVKVPN